MKYSRKHGMPTFRAFDELFNQNLETFFGSDFSTMALPAANVKETGEDFTIELVAAGFQKDDFNINLEKGFLKISVAAEQEKTEEGEKYTRKEFSKRSFSRSFELPESVNAEGITASYEGGILKLTLPKLEEVKTQKKLITVS